MKKLLLIFSIVFLSLHGYAQDTIRTHVQDTIRTATNKGYEIDFPFVHFNVDTIHHITTITSYYHGNLLGIGNDVHYFSVNGGKARPLKKEDSFDIWSEHLVLTVTRKKYKKVYKI